MNKLPDIKSGINEKLKELGPDLDISKAPPINQKRLVTFINHFLLSTVDFINKFSKHCTYKLITFDEKINRIEAELCLLESKLNSIPEISDVKDVNIELPKPEDLSSNIPNKTGKELEDYDSSIMIKEVENEVSSLPEVDEVDPPNDSPNPLLAKYRKMVHVGVPIPAVKIKMQTEGLDPNLLDA